MEKGCGGSVAPNLRGHRRREYSHEGIKSSAQRLFSQWLALLPPKTPVYYTDENSKRFSKLTPKAIEKVHAELAPASIEKKYKCYFFKSASADVPMDECHAYSFEIYAAGTYSGFVFVTFPRDHVETHGSDRVLDWFANYSREHGFTHGGAGFGFEVAWFGDQEQAAMPKVLATGLRFHGVRVWDRQSARFRKRNKNTLDTAAWLTYLGASSVADITEGAIAGIPNEVRRHPAGAGAVLQAGVAPDPCDSNERGQLVRRTAALHRLVARLV